MDKLDNIKKMYIINFFLNLSFFGPLAVAFFLDWGHLDYTRMFLIESVFMLTIFLCQIPTGVFADKYGRKNSILIGIVFSVVSTLILITYPNFWVFLIAEILGGFGAAFVSGANNALIFDTLKQAKDEKQSKQVFANFSLFSTVAVIIAFPVGSFVAGLKFMPYPSILVIPFLLSAATSAIAGIIALFIAEPPITPSKETAFEMGLKGLMELKTNKPLRSLALDMTMISITGFFMFWFYQSLLRNAGLDISFWGLVAAGYNILSALLLWKLTSIEKIIGTKTLLFVSALLIGLCYIVLGAYSALWFSLISIFLITNLRIIRAPLFTHYMNIHLGSERRATVLSAVDMIQRLGMVIAYPLVGALSDISLNLAFMVLGVLTIVFALLLRSDEAAFERKK